MIKSIKGWEVNKSLENNYVVVKSFPGATTTCMEHYLVPSLDKKPDQVILHVGTNDLKKVDPPKVICSRIMKLAKKCSETSTVIVSGIIKRGDKLNTKAEAVMTF